MSWDDRAALRCERGVAFVVVRIGDNLIYLQCGGLFGEGGNKVQVVVVR